ncbi:RNA-directed DNA polymerase, eukaryota [Tanacetum coccineum]
MDSISHMDVEIFVEVNPITITFVGVLRNSGGILAIYGTWLPTNSKILFIAIYAPQQTSCKRKLWDYISNIVGRWNGESIIMGDFNEVRSSEERRGSCFNPYSARYFDRFISNAGLVDVTLEGYAFTWAHPSASKMSKLDRFLVSDGSKNEMISELGAIDKDMDRGVFDDDTVFRRFELKHKLLNVSEMESKDNFQNLKSSWAGVMVGEYSSRIKAWDDVILKLRSRPPHSGSVLKVMGDYGSNCWIGDVPLRVKFPRLFALDLNKEASVAVKLSAPIDISFRRNARGGIEEHLLADLTLLMDSVTLSNYSCISLHRKLLANLAIGDCGLTEALLNQSKDEEVKPLKNQTKPKSLELMHMGHPALDNNDENNLRRLPILYAPKHSISVGYSTYILGDAYTEKYTGIIPSDLVVTIDEKPHPFFKRDGNDLVVTRKISLAEALTGYTVHLSTLDARNLTIPIKSIINWNFATEMEQNPENTHNN